VPEEPPEAAPQPPDQIGIAPGEASASAPTEGSPGLATPAARTVAREHGVSLADIAGSGPDGCIVKRDVLTGLQAHDQSWEGTSEPLSPLRRALAARLQRSVREAPHFYVAMEVDMTQALIARKACEPAATVTDAIVKAVADTLTEFPRIHCKLDGDTVHYAPEVNVGIAVSVDDGVVVPTLPRPDMLTLAEVAARSRELIANVRAGRLPAGSASTFTVSNLGMFGVKSFTAIINPPEVAVLAVGAIEDKLVLRDGSVAAVPTLSLTLSCDHRVIDGALAARFLQALKRRLETPWAG